MTTIVHTTPGCCCCITKTLRQRGTCRSGTPRTVRLLWYVHPICHIAYLTLVNNVPKPLKKGRQIQINGLNELSTKTFKETNLLYPKIQNMSGFI